MDRNIQQEEFSYAYIQTVAAAAGYSVVIKPRAIDFAGIDLSIEMLADNQRQFSAKKLGNLLTALQNLFDAIGRSELSQNLVQPEIKISV